MTGPLELGKQLEERGDLESAAAAYRDAIRIDPGNADAHATLGNILLHTGRTQEAVAEYRAAFDLDPQNKSLQERFAFAQSWHRTVVCESSVRMDPNNAEAHNNLGNAFLESGYLDGAVAEFRAALQLQPSNGEWQRNLESALYRRRIENQRYRFTVVLKDIGPNRVEVIRAVRQFMPLMTIGDVVNLLERIPATLRENISWDEAEAMETKLWSAGALVAVQRVVRAGVDYI